MVHKHCRSSQVGEGGIRSSKIEMQNDGDVGGRRVGRVRFDHCKEGSSKTPGGAVDQVAITAPFLLYLRDEMARIAVGGAEQKRCYLYHFGCERSL